MFENFTSLDASQYDWLKNSTMTYICLSNSSVCAYTSLLIYQAVVIVLLFISIHMHFVKKILAFVFKNILKVFVLMNNFMNTFYAYLTYFL